MKKAKKWNNRLTALVDAKKKVKGADKAKIQKAINAEYKRLGMNSKGELKNKTIKPKVKNKVVKVKTNKTAADMENKNRRTAKNTKIPKSFKLSKDPSMKAKAYRETEEWLKKNKLAPKKKATKRKKK